jgi:hypothetical protein
MTHDFVSKQEAYDASQRSKRAPGGCLGFYRRGRTWQATKRCGDRLARGDPQVSEWGNPVV